MPKTLLRLRVNGEDHDVAAAPHKTLLEVLREEMGLTGTKHGCELGECGTCTVLVDGEPVLSCLALPVELERAQRLGYPLALVMLDLDRFKVINDRYGHPAGDDALRQIAPLIHQVTRSMDTLARYGGEEFALILPGSDLDEAMAVAERLRSLLAGSLLSAGGGCVVSASLGVAVHPRHALTTDDLVKLADAALYAAKRAGRNRVVAAGEAQGGRAAKTTPGAVS